MNRRSFLQLTMALTAAPVIGLPEVAAGAPAIAFTNAELAKIAEECLIELEENEPFGSYFEPKKFTMFQGHKFYYNERLPA